MIWVCVSAPEIRPDAFGDCLFRNGTALRASERIRHRFSDELSDACAGPVFASAGFVIWFYERKGEHLRCEIRQQIEGDRFALVVTLPDGTERTEVFDDSSALNRRSLELEKLLCGKGWNGPYSRDF